MFSHPKTQSLHYRSETEKPDFERTFYAYPAQAFEERFAVANFYFDDPYITWVKRDSKLTFAGRLVRYVFKSNVGLLSFKILVVFYSTDVE